MTNANDKFMKQREIEKAIASANKKISDARIQIDQAQLEIRHIREICPHTDKESWTNDDGDGQLKVEKCRICGLQRDGGIEMNPRHVPWKKLPRAERAEILARMKDTAFPL